jgi:hypothetical protein
MVRYGDRTEKKFDTGLEVKDVRELWACTTESLDKGTCHLVHGKIILDISVTPNKKLNSFVL